MADGIVTTLLENIVVNLNDATTYTALAQIKGVLVAPEMVLLADASPWVVVVPGSPTDEEVGVTINTWWQPVTCYIGIRRATSHDGDWGLLGSSGQNGLDTLAKDVRQALNRTSPYSDNKPSASYGTQVGVHDTRYAGLEYLGIQEEEHGQESQVAALTIEYFCVDERDV
jgi:hypothetical protein